MKKVYIGYITLLTALLYSCEKKELPVKAHNAGSSLTATVNLGTPYTYQVYYCLATHSIAGQNEKTAWDIGLEPSASGYHIVLNSSKSMFALSTGKADFSAVSIGDTIGFSANRKWDAPSGNFDSTAIGDWRGITPVYIINCGYSPAGAGLGMKKLQVLSVTDSVYQIRFADLDGTNDTTILVAKDTAYNLAFVSFAQKQQVMIQPPKNTWDLAFTQYTYVFYNYTPPIPYLVTGCLLNRSSTFAIKDTSLQFDQINYDIAKNIILSSDISSIGYDWKTFSGTSYTINTSFSYIVQTKDKLLYKLHFTGYYDSKGHEGNPQWEYQRL